MPYKVWGGRKRGVATISATVAFWPLSCDCSKLLEGVEARVGIDCLDGSEIRHGRSPPSHPDELAEAVATLGHAIRSLTKRDYQFRKSEKTVEDEKLCERKARDVMDDLLEGATSGVSEERIAKWLVTRLLTIINTPSGSKKDNPLLDEELLFLYGVRMRFGWNQELSKIAAPIVKGMTASSEKAQEFFDELVKTQSRVN